MRYIFEGLQDMNLLAERIKIDALAYWKYTKHHLLGAIECWNADVLTVSRSYLVTETEVKTSIKDLKQDGRKRYKHWTFKTNRDYKHRQVHYLYYILPIELKEKALNIINSNYPYAGLLVWENGQGNIYKQQGITLVRKAKRFKRPIAVFEDLQRIGYMASNNIIKYATNPVYLKDYRI